jgi:hypothetical protein
VAGKTSEAAYRHFEISTLDAYRLSIKKGVGHFLAG